LKFAAFNRPNVTQSKKDKDAENDMLLEIKKKTRYLVEFIHRQSNWMKDYGDRCDPDQHIKQWDPITKNIFAADETFFSDDKTWHGKICNRFHYLDCKENPTFDSSKAESDENRKGSCVCGGYDEFTLHLEYVPVPDPNATNSQPLSEISKKRRCMAKLGEFCNFVRLENNTFPGVDWPLSDYFSCVPLALRNKTSGSGTYMAPVVCPEEFSEFKEHNNDTYTVQKCTWLNPVGE
jgi:hypothetical protein